MGQQMNIFRVMTLTAALVLAAGVAQAAQCGSDAGGFESWKSAFAPEAKAAGVGPRGLSALAGTHYATKTIYADRHQKSFHLSLSEFMRVRGSAAIIARGRSLKAQNAGLFASIEQRYGVPPGPVIAIWGMETGFGAVTGNQNTISAVASLAYDCRRHDYFTEQFVAALKLVDKGVLSASTIGAMHGEVGQTQFMPKNIFAYGVGGSLTVKENALASTANFLRGHGWRRGAGYQPGEANFAAIQEWNAASVYQQALAIMGKQIDQ
jgi:membrane-bound lytic murein transglycosylase B